MIINNVDYDDLSIVMIDFQYCYGDKTGSCVYSVVSKQYGSVGLVTTTSSGDIEHVKNECLKKATSSIARSGN